MGTLRPERKGNVLNDLDRKEEKPWGQDPMKIPEGPAERVLFHWRSVPRPGGGSGTAGSTSLGSGVEGMMVQRKEPSERHGGADASTQVPTATE